jgi:hypothetical protein
MAFRAKAVETEEESSCAGAGARVGAEEEGESSGAGAGASACADEEAQTRGRQPPVAVAPLEGCSAVAVAPLEGCSAATNRRGRGVAPGPPDAASRWLTFFSLGKD